MSEPAEIAKLSAEAIAEELRPTLFGSVLVDCVKRGRTKANDGALVDDLISNLCSRTSENIFNGWLVTWSQNPDWSKDGYMSIYTPTDLGKQVAALLSDSPAVQGEGK